MSIHYSRPVDTSIRLNTPSAHGFQCPQDIGPDQRSCVVYIRLQITTLLKIREPESFSMPVAGSQKDADADVDVTILVGRLFHWQWNQSLTVIRSKIR